MPTRKGGPRVARQAREAAEASEALTRARAAGMKYEISLSDITEHRGLLAPTDRAMHQIGG